MTLMRAVKGSGCVYRRGNVLWITFSFKGKKFNESAHTTDEKVARQLIETRMKELAASGFIGPSPTRGETVLYVIQRGDDGPIKVGISRNLKKRLEALQNGNAEKLHVLQVYKMRDFEKAIHNELKRVARLEGEWFPAELLGLIARFFGKEIG